MVKYSLHSNYLMRGRLELDHDESQIWWLETRHGSWYSVSLKESAAVRMGVQATNLDVTTHVTHSAGRALTTLVWLVLSNVVIFLGGWDLLLFGFENQNIVMKGAALWGCACGCLSDRHRVEPTCKSTAPIIDALWRQHQRAIPDSRGLLSVMC